MKTIFLNWHWNQLKNPKSFVDNDCKVIISSLNDEGFVNHIKKEYKENDEILILSHNNNGRAISVPKEFIQERIKNKNIIICEFKGGKDFVYSSLNGESGLFDEEDYNSPEDNINILIHNFGEVWDHYTNKKDSQLEEIKKKSKNLVKDIYLPFAIDIEGIIGVQDENTKIKYRNEALQSVKNNESLTKSIKDLQTSIKPIIESLSKPFDEPENWDKNFELLIQKSEKLKINLMERWIEDIEKIIDNYSDINEN